ncbi:GAF domain-containing protein [Pseudonocardia sediminis]|uniref:GAF domain-containing protein n=1 Tax=Pseudonocardia sediminis TaxID=1397368 RepID=A0A4Q7V281_PSEST|nr:GAF domain-containing SpoIIE family protein phosphatase [Pseudonocardia sediminis]RZT88466.1 GAF domain-containing protein [Pseudonocardia sediminis]
MDVIRTPAAPGVPEIAAALLAPERLSAVMATGLLDSPPEQAYDDLVELAQELTGARNAVFTVIDTARSYRKSARGPGPPAGTQEPVHDAPGQLVVALGEPLVVDDAPADERVSGMGIVRSMRVGSVLCLPVYGADEQVIGALCVSHERAHHWSPRVVHLLATVARAIGSQIRLRSSLVDSRRRADQLGVRLADSRRSQADLYTALGESRTQSRALQAGLLPPVLSAIPGADVAAAYVPAGSGTEVIGDFYDLFRAGDDWCAVMGDVCGKGIEAAQIAALARYTIRVTTTWESDPAAVLRRLDTALRAEFGGTFLTATVAVLRPDGAGGLTGTLSSAGHEPVLVLRAGGDIDVVGTGGTMLGVLDAPLLHTETVHLRSGDLMLLYTDGVTEARSGPGAELFGDQRLLDALRTCGGRTAEETVHRIYTGVTDYARGNASDDTAVLAVLAAQQQD